MAVATFSRFACCLALGVLFSGQILQTLGAGVGINYGQIANNLPSPTSVVKLLQSINISRVKLYDADPKVLTAFGNSGVEFIIAIGNENILNMTDLTKAQEWLKQNVQPYLHQTQITCVTVGNEVLTTGDTVLMQNLLPAMQSVYQALVALGLDKQVNISSAHSVAILGNSYPPSSGSFREDVAEYIHPLLNFHSEINSPFLINAYPFFAYKGNPNGVSLEYVLFQDNPGVIDPNTNLTYDNMLYAQIDSVYAAIKAMGHTDIDVAISETGWPSKGDPDETGATLENAATYNRNLLRRIAMNQGTPMKPTVPINVHVFALFNEDLKPGAASERNYGLFYPDGTPVYDIGFQDHLLLSSSSSAKLMAWSRFGILIFAMVMMT
ncbi:Glycosyl hydrolases family 17 [Musa troglodytarum]|uniref:glucan endo-1,3-beta-D-glucosidase n=1 Tax=Musa troglodytarum TaxID=320322 RepID=A0A9E7JH09_9LILI|nr:Glycosyl hydrolases family 17 [Musa troglodytarum]URD80535.1 Glycosyl hydrolases family 17 [Musa troglodytarum]URD80537.1 Glycosyl hydrolases family 17 [Musa troglodytarum]